MPIYYFFAFSLGRATVKGGKNSWNNSSMCNQWVLLTQANVSGAQQMPAESPALSVQCFPCSPDGGIGNLLHNLDGTNVKGRLLELSWEFIVILTSWRYHLKKQLWNLLRECLSYCTLVEVIHQGIGKALQKKRKFIFCL